MVDRRDIFHPPVVQSDRVIDKVDSKIDRLIEINKSQVEDIKDVKDEVSEIKESIAELSSQFKLHSFEDATRFSAWESKMNKEIEPVLKHVNERIALGGWLKGNQKLIIFFILIMLTVFGIVRADQLMSFVGVNTDYEDKPKIEQKIETTDTPLQRDLSKALDVEQKSL